MGPTERREWLLAPLAVAGAFFVSGLSAMLAAAVLELWEVPVSGFCAAFAVVSVAYIAAPRHKINFALLCFIVGAVAAWLLLSDFDPEHDPAIANRRALLEFLVTLSGGGIALIGVFWHAWRSPRRAAPHAP